MPSSLKPGHPSSADLGMTLIEVIIAVLVLSIGLMAAWGSIDQSRRAIGGHEARLLAHQVALNRAAELRLMGMEAGRTLPSTVAMGPVRWQVGVTERETRIGLIAAEIAVSAPGQPGARLVVHVTPSPPPDEEESP